MNGMAASKPNLAAVFAFHSMQCTWYLERASTYSDLACTEWKPSPSVAGRLANRFFGAVGEAERRLDRDAGDAGPVLALDVLQIPSFVGLGPSRARVGDADQRGGRLAGPAQLLRLTEHRGGVEPTAHRDRDPAP